MIQKNLKKQKHKIQPFYPTVVQSRLPQQYYDKKLCYCRGSARHLSVEILQLQNISLENPIVWHYLHDSTFSHFDTIPECDRHTDRRTDTRRRHIPHLAYRRVVKIDHIARHTNYNYHCRQRVTVDSKMYGYYHIFER